VKFQFQEYRRMTIIPLVAVALGAYYIFVFLPLGRRAESLDAPLGKAWQTLTNTLNLSNAVAIDFQRITNQLTETRQALVTL
jgi:hypothetical protein